MNVLLHYAPCSFVYYFTSDSEFTLRILGKLCAARSRSIQLAMPFRNEGNNGAVYFLP